MLMPSRCLTQSSRFRYSSVDGFFLVQSNEDFFFLPVMIDIAVQVHTNMFSTKGVVYFMLIEWWCVIQGKQRARNACNLALIMTSDDDGGRKLACICPVGELCCVLYVVLGQLA